LAGREESSLILLRDVVVRMLLLGRFRRFNGGGCRGYAADSRSSYATSSLPHLKHRTSLV